MASMDSFHGEGEDGDLHFPFSMSFGVSWRRRSKKNKNKVETLEC